MDWLNKEGIFAKDNIEKAQPVSLSSAVEPRNISADNSRITNHDSYVLDCLYILNGLLIGSAVGAGFAVFESAGYAFQALWYGNSYSSMVNAINIRAILSSGGHVVWAAITGAALMIALGGKIFTWNAIKNKKFVRLFIIPVILHSVWDMPIPAIQEGVSCTAKA